MAKGKLEKFKEFSGFGNTLEYTDFLDEEASKPAGCWNSKIFENERPIVLELACGKGDYTLALARQNPHKNFIGVDLKGDRIWKGAKQALEEGLINVRFLRIFIDHLDVFFAPDEIHGLWITFPDPYPKQRDRNKRLTSPKFLDVYKRVLVPGGKIRLKTDCSQLFSYTLNILKKRGCRVLDVVENIYEERSTDPLLTHKTFYERRHLKNGKTISFCEFCLSDFDNMDK